MPKTFTAMIAEATKALTSTDREAARQRLSDECDALDMYLMDRDERATLAELYDAVHEVLDKLDWLD